MNEAIREELIRFGETFVARLKFVLGGTLVGTIFLFFYAGIKANYEPFEILAAVSLTLSTVIVCAAILAVIVHAYTTRHRQRER
jgi:Kef-type K+ transport system membrane component KefB